MFWFVLFLIGAVCLLASLTATILNTDEDVSFALFTIGIIVFVIFGITCLIGSIMSTTDGYQLRKSTAMLPIKVEQQKQLMDLVSKQLSADQLNQLAVAIDPKSAAIIIGRETAASAVLLDRAGQIIDLNRQIYDLRNNVVSKQIDICNNLDNMFIPRFSFWHAGCHYSFVQPIPSG